jgi:hypothetical protein
MLVLALVVSYDAENCPLGPSLLRPLLRLLSPTTQTLSFRDSPIAVAVPFDAEIYLSGLCNRAQVVPPD